METKHELHPELHDASLEKACDLARDLSMSTPVNPYDVADLHYMLEYLRLNFDLVPKK